MVIETTSANLLTADALLDHWQGHRRLTRKTIEAFPEDKLFQFSLGGMRPFAAMVSELIAMTIPLVEGIASGKWAKFEHWKPQSKSELLDRWDADTAQLKEKFQTIPPARFTETDKAFGMWEMTGFTGIQYTIENEIHHRGEAYVYLRVLGIEPPVFYDRS